jgi:exonuclease SbcC
MRILAIRGCNLASLAGEFEIDLAHGPLGGAGVFAIVGPTGAGKSTLLDAMCVALFDRTPRLANHSRVVVGRGEDDPAALGAQDVRGLLRRGAAQGWAEVDFEAGDARRYRARWAVRRARGASDGRYQDQQVTLEMLDGGERLGGTRTETLVAIRERLGLSFDQFRRSALLAQGEFAAFLRADGRDRSELLERMTGTEIYSRLSVAAHARAAVALQQLRDLQGAAAAIPVLADDARTAAEAGQVIAVAARGAARERLAEAEAAARWVAESTRRERELAEAIVASEAAERAIADANDARTELALRRRAEPLRALWDDVARLDRQQAIARGELAASEQQVARADEARRACAARRARLGELHAPLRAARIAAGIVERPRAGALDEARVGEAVRASAWLGEHAALAGEIAGWATLDAQLAQLAQLAGELAAADAAVAEHVRSRGALAEAKQRAEQAHRAAGERLAEAQREAARFRERRGLSLDEAGKRERAARHEYDQADRLVKIADEAGAAATLRRNFVEQLAELDTDADVDAELRAIVEAERDQADAMRRERERAVGDLRRAAGLAHARAELVDGEPCPLCGALEHPWRDRGAFDELIGEADERLAEAAAGVERAAHDLAHVAARDRQRAKERARLVACLATADATAASAAERWRAQLATIGELPLVADPAAREAGGLARERAAAAWARLEAASDARRQVEAVATAMQEAQAVIVTRQAELAQRADELRAADAALGKAAAAIERLDGEREVKRARVAELRASTADRVDQWSTVREGEGPRPVLAKGDRWSTAIAGEGLADVRRAVAALAQRWRDSADRVAEADAMLGGALSAIDDQVRDLERAHAEHEARRAQLAVAREQRVGEHANAMTRLDAARGDLTRDELQHLLADPARAELIAEQLAALDRAADRARTRVGERRRLVDENAAARPHVLDDAGAVEALARAVVDADHRAAALAAALAADDDARGRRAAARAELAAAEQHAEIDRVLGEVIGSHDGKLFRSFAQSLTLDSLLAVANAHLDELAPRYQLERVPKHDLELQVIDRELGSDVRSVQSLSGGESFLVSLALALGLSSMSAHDVRVRTLLIDEGFGTLDPTTLDGALAVLDALQATGRQVGIISHVPALVERVGAHVRVAPRGGGKSSVIVLDPHAA